MYTPVELVRGCWRSAKLIAVLLWAAVEAGRSAQSDVAMQSRLRRRWARRMLRVMNVRVHQQGEVPMAGLLVSNHLGYMDVLVYAAVLEGTFLSKAEVATWPLLGRLTRAVGTLFVERDSARSTAVANKQIAALLEQGQQVLIFPEGTSSGGDNVLPFQSPFFDAPQRTHAPVWTAAVAYSADLPHGTVRDRICYWGDMVIGPHLFGLLCVRSIEARVCFSAMPIVAEDRRAAAKDAHKAVCALYESLRVPERTSQVA